MENSVPIGALFSCERFPKVQPGVWGFPTGMKPAGNRIRSEAFLADH